MAQVFLKRCRMVLVFFEQWSQIIFLALMIYI